MLTSDPAKRGLGSMPSMMRFSRGWAVRFFAVTVLVVLVFALAACGSSKPAYCSTRTSLENSVKGLGDVDVKSGGVAALQSQLKKVQSDATALVNSAKGDFPSETSAIQSSVAALSNAIKTVPSSPSAADVAKLVGDVTSVANSVKGFTDATDSKCS
jgi:hypothetical protein